MGEVGNNDRPAPVAVPPGVPGPGVTKPRALWAAAGTVVLSLLLCEAAGENIWRASPIRWWILAATLAGALVVATGWRKLRWPWALCVTSIVGLSLVVFASLRLGSAADPGFHVAWLALARVVALLAAAAVGLASFVLIRLSLNFVRLRWYLATAATALGLYAVVPLAVALVRGIPVGGTFRGEGLWSLPPYWLQGSYIAVELVIPAGLVGCVALLVWSFVRRAPERRLWLGLSSLALLAMFFVLSVELSRAGLPHLSRAAVDPVLARLAIAGAPVARRSAGDVAPTTAGPGSAGPSSTDTNQPLKYAAPKATPAAGAATTSEVKTFEVPAPEILAAARAARIESAESRDPDGWDALAVVPSSLPTLAKATPAVLDGATDIQTDRIRAFKVTIPPGAPLELHAGTLGYPNSRLRVLDSEGYELKMRSPPKDLMSRWHGRVAPGDYYIVIEGPRNGLKVADDAATANLAAQPTLLTIGTAFPQKRTPQTAAQLGLDWLEVDTPSWQNKYGCGGCHIQTQTLMGMTLAKKNGYRVQERAALALGEFLVANKSTSADHYQQFRQLGLRYYVEGFAPERADVALRAAREELFAKPPKDFVFPGTNRRPVEAGPITATSMAVQTLLPLVKLARDPGEAELFRSAVAAGLAYLRTAKQETVQDRTMRIIAFSDAREGKDVIDADVAGILAMQNADGGFGEKPGGGPSNAYGTGQALYALKTGGLSVSNKKFRAGVKWLMDHQRSNGAWQLGATATQSDIAPTMWAVIGLAGTFGTKEELLVPVRVVAEDAAGRTLNDLQVADFTILEDGQEQRVVSAVKETGDFTIVLIADTSGSIRAALPIIKQAATGFLGLLQPKDRVTLIEFADRPRKPLPFSTDRGPLRKQIAAMAARGGTALYDSVLSALDALEDKPTPQAIVLITDGKDENDPGTAPGSTATLPAALTRLGELRIPVYAIGLGSRVERDVLSQVAGSSGGRAYFVNMPQELPKLYADLAAALRSQYVVTYSSSRPEADGKWRAITVKRARDATRIDATPGFMATPDMIN